MFSGARRRHACTADFYLIGHNDALMQRRIELEQRATALVLRSSDVAADPLRSSTVTEPTWNCAAYGYKEPWLFRRLCGQRRFSGHSETPEI